MKIKKVLTSNLKPGMVSAEAAYTYSNHLVIQSNTVLTDDIIDKLKYYAIKAVKIQEPEENETPPETDTNPTYFERIQQSAEFREFESSFSDCLGSFSTTLNDLVTKNADGLIDDMLNNVGSLIGKSRNPLHMLDMMQCMRGYDDLTYTHSLSVALICNVIGTWMHFNDEDMNILILCGLLHDIGKLKIPPEIIKKPGKLTDEEFALIRKHPQYGYDILNTKNLDPRIKYAALRHHERFDGKGYPLGLANDEIDLFSSIVAVADVYDAMTADRVYRKGICPFPVLEQMEREKNLYNPSALCQFIEHTVEAYVNTEVLLSNGEKGRVVLLNKNFLSRPIVITDTKTYDLSKDSSIQITSLI